MQWQHGEFAVKTPLSGTSPTCRTWSSDPAAEVDDLSFATGRLLRAERMAKVLMKSAADIMLDEGPGRSQAVQDGFAAVVFALPAESLEGEAYWNRAAELWGELGRVLREKEEKTGSEEGNGAEVRADEAASTSSGVTTRTRGDLAVERASNALQEVGRLRMSVKKLEQEWAERKAIDSLRESGE